MLTTSCAMFKGKLTTILTYEAMQMHKWRSYRFLKSGWKWLDKRTEIWRQFWLL